MWSLMWSNGTISLVTRVSHTLSISIQKRIPTFKKENGKKEREEHHQKGT